MAEKREMKRHRKRFAVRYGLETLNQLGFTDDISDGGIFIKAGVVQGIGRELQVEMKIDEARIVRFVGRVQWAKKIPPALLRTAKGGMGLLILRFHEGEEHYRSVCAELAQR